MTMYREPLRSCDRPFTCTGIHRPSSSRWISASTPRSSNGRNTCSRPCDWTTSSTHTSHSASWPTTLSWSRCQEAGLTTVRVLPRARAEIDRRPRLSVHLEPEDVWASVVPGDVQSPLRRRRALGVAIREQDAVLFVQRAGDQLAVGRDDDRIARVEPLLQIREHACPFWEVGGDVFSSHRGSVPQHPAPPFRGDVPHCRHPRAAGIPRRRDIYLAALRKQAEARQRHVVLPTDQ